MLPVRPLAGQKGNGGPPGFGSCKPAGKPGSVPVATASRSWAPGRRRTVIHLGRRLPGASSGLTRGTESEQLLNAEAFGPCSTLLRAGFTRPAGHPAAGGLLPHHFTVAPLPRLCLFCGTLLRVTPTGRYPAPCSVEPGLSSNGEPSATVWPACGSIVFPVRPALSMPTYVCSLDGIPGVVLPFAPFGGAKW